MLPNLSLFTERHPRFVSIIGIGVFISGAYLWVASSLLVTAPISVSQEATVIGSQETDTTSTSDSAPEEGNEATGLLIDGEMATVATVNMSDATVLPSEYGEYKAQFTISNRVGVQGNIKYYLEIRNSAGTPVDTVYNENWKLGLGEAESKNLEITYKIPQYLLVGEYEVWALSENTAGLLLGFVNLGTLEISEVGAHAGAYIHPEDCVTLASSPEAEGQKLVEETFIAETENIDFTCLVTHFGDESETVVPRYIVSTQSSQNVVNEIIGDTEILLDGKILNPTSFTLPTAKEPQIYRVALSLVDVATQAQVSNAVVFEYYVPGTIASIRNVVLDSTEYSIGDTVHAQVYLDFMTEDDVSSFVLKAVLANAEGTACGSEVVREYTKDTIQQAPASTIDVPVTSDCAGARMNTTLANASGEIFDQAGYSLSADNRYAQTAHADNSIEEENAVSKVITFGSIVLLLIVILIALVFMRRNKGAVIGAIFFALIISQGIGSASVSADTFVLGGRQTPGGIQVTMSLNPSKTTYNVGEKVGVDFAVTVNPMKNEGWVLSALLNGANAREIMSTVIYDSTYSAKCNYTSKNQPYVYVDNVVITGATEVGCGAISFGGEDSPGYSVNDTCSDVSCRTYLGAVTQPEIIDITYANHCAQVTDERCTSGYWPKTSFTIPANPTSGTFGFQASPIKVVNGAVSYVAGSSNSGVSYSSLSGSMPYTIAVVPPAAPTLTLTANPVNISSGAATQLTWSSTGATQCTASGGWTGSKSATGGNTQVNPSGNTTYSLTCTGPGGSVTRDVIVTACPSNTPTWNGSQCVSNASATYSCSGSIPSGATAFAGDDEGVTAPTTWTNSNTNTPVKCQYTCGLASYTGGQCVGTNPPPSSAYIRASDCTIGVGSASCQSTVSWSSESVAKPSVRQDGTEFSHLYSSPASGVSRAITNGTHTFTFYKESNNTKLASDTATASCVSGTSWDTVQSKCISSAPTYSCTGTVPNNATLCTNDNTGLSANTPNTSVVSCGAPKCEYMCSANTILSGGACVATQCSDGIDNDGDGKSDLTDPGCTGPTDDSEDSDGGNGGGNGGGTGGGSTTQCSDGLDNDNDGLSDLNDPDCSGPTDDTESGTSGPVIVGAPDLNASPRMVKTGGSTTLTWTNITGSCTLTGGGLNKVVTGNSSEVRTINAATTFTLTCGSFTDVVSVDVIPNSWES